MFITKSDFVANVIQYFYCISMLFVRAPFLWRPRILRQLFIDYFDSLTAWRTSFRLLPFVITDVLNTDNRKPILQRIPEQCQKLN